MADIKELTVGGTTYKIKDEVCRTNIWSVQNKVGKNLLNFKAWSEAVPVNKGTKTVSDNAITLTATDNDCYTKYGASEYPQDVRIKVNPGDVLTLSWDYSAGSSQSDDKVYIFGYNETEPPLSNVNVSSQTGYLQYTVPANAKFCTFRLGVTTSGNTATYSNIMICDKAVYDQDSSFQPYGAPNYDLTYREAEDRAALVPVIDKGAKNLFDWKNSEVKTYNPYHATVSKTESSFTITSANVSAAYGFVLSLPKGDYVLTTTISNFSGSNSCWCVIAVGEPYSLSNVVNQYTFNDNCNIELNFTLTQTSNVYVMYYANKVGTSYIDTTSFTASNLMICTEEEFKISPAHAPFTLPNYDLTVREAEDRAALAEQVDEGAKNILDEWNEILKNRSTSGNSVTVHGITYTNTNGTITMSGTADNPSDNAATLFLLVDTMKLSNGSYVISWRSKSISNVQTNIKYLNMVEAIQSTDSVIELPSNRTDSASMWISIPNGTTVSGSIDIMICTLADWKISQNYAPFALPNTDLTRMVNDLQKKAVKVYTYHVNPNESDPEDAVTYLDDATGLTPAKMGASSFSYGSWANAWFLPKPCMLKSDGTVAYYLNPNDYSKKTDGTASDIADANFDGNVMLEFPKIWVKRVAGSASGERTVSIAPVNVDGTYKCWSNINAEDKEVDHFYLPAYNGTIHSSKMRSLSGVTLDTTYAPNYTRAQEVTAAIANNPSGKNMWYTETWADMCLVYDLLYLMGKSLDVQRTFGQGLSSGAETAMRAYVTGTHNAKGLFYGDISGTSTAVKVLGMENLWGCRWHGVAGLINDNGTLKVKMTYGVADGSTAVGYNTTGDGYLNYGSTYGTNGFVKKMQADNTMGYKIIETAGTDATYYCDYYYVNNSQSNYALLGGSPRGGASCGFCVCLDSEAATASWLIGGSLSCRP